MQVETLKDVLEWTEAFHNNLYACLHHCAGSNENIRAKMLLDYLAQHEKKLSEIVSQFEETADAKALDTWCYDYLEKHPVVHRTQCDAPFQELGPDEIMEIITDQHEQIIDLYRSLHARMGTAATQELLESLVSLEEHEAMQITQGANRMQEM